MVQRITLDEQIDTRQDWAKMDPKSIIGCQSGTPLSKMAWSTPYNGQLSLTLNGVVVLCSPLILCNCFWTAKSRMSDHFLAQSNFCVTYLVTTTINNLPGKQTALP